MPSSILNEFGREVFDQTPVSFPIKFERPTPLHLRIRNQIINLQNEMRFQTEVETPEEADDFNMPEDPEMWQSPYEVDFDHINDEKFTSATNADPQAAPREDLRADPQAVPHEDAETPPA